MKSKVVEGWYRKRKKKTSIATISDAPAPSAQTRASKSLEISSRQISHAAFELFTQNFRSASTNFVFGLLTFYLTQHDIDALLQCFCGNSGLVSMIDDLDKYRIHTFIRPIAHICSLMLASPTCPRRRAEILCRCPLLVLVSKPLSVIVDPVLTLPAIQSKVPPPLPPRRRPRPSSTSARSLAAKPSLSVSPNPIISQCNSANGDVPMKKLCVKFAAINTDKNSNCQEISKFAVASKTDPVDINIVQRPLSAPPTHPNTRTRFTIRILSDIHPLAHASFDNVSRLSVNGDVPFNPFCMKFTDVARKLPLKASLPLVSHSKSCFRSHRSPSFSIRILTPIQLCSAVAA
jgi:hypothetical protein